MRLRFRKKKNQPTPSVEFVPVIHGKWVEDLPPWEGCTCSACGEKWLYQKNDNLFIKKKRFCPYCGARMDLK